MGSSALSAETVEHRDAQCADEVASDPPPEDSSWRSSPGHYRKG